MTEKKPDFSALVQAYQRPSVRLFAG